MRNKTILILGAGQIGEACALKSIKNNPKRIILHTLTKKEAVVVFKNIQANLGDCNIDIQISWGNALVTKKLMNLNRDELHVSENRKELIRYYYSYLSDDLIKESSLYYLVKKWKPDYIFDGINTATVVGYQDDPYSLPRRILNKGDKKQDWCDSTENLLVSNIVPSLIRFTQALKKSLLDFKVKCYVKVSTTGLGGMGDNLFYTHGDVNEPGMSSGILGKVAAAGVIHQLFWGLSHTPGINVKVVVPAALVGWQGVGFGQFRSHGRGIPLVDSKTKTKLVSGEVFVPGKCEQISTFMEMPYVDSGENCAYSLGEMTAITALGQMECVTREEVAQACIEMAIGSTRHDLLTAMDLVALGPSHLGGIQRRIILDRLTGLEVKNSIPSIATNNLGPTVSKHLFEIYLMLACSQKSLSVLVKSSSGALVKKINKFLEDNQQVRSQIVSLGLPIIFNDDHVTAGEYFYVPNIKEENIISTKNIDLWANSGWIDLREKNIKYWQSIIKKILTESKKDGASGLIATDRNYIDIENADIGEILGYVYSMLGGQRKTEFLKSLF
ncbi:MAG: hypothetical protein WCO12_00155 [bacterium]